MRETDGERERDRDRERKRERVTSRGLISEVNHFEQQRESPGWKISEQEARDSQREMVEGIKREERLDGSWKISK